MYAEAEKERENSLALDTVYPPAPLSVMDDEIVFDGILDGTNPIGRSYQTLIMVVVVLDVAAYILGGYAIDYEGIFGSLYPER